jgi:FkbM family methyltransferase
MGKSNLAFHLAERVPFLGKGFLFLWARGHFLISRDAQPPAHWFFSQLANALDYRVPVRTRLRNGMSIRVACNDHVGGSILRLGYYEPEIVHLIEKLLKPGMVFLDVGAHVGQYTLYASRLVGETGQVHSFEPDPKTFQWLASNIKLNCLQNVHANQMALSDVAGSRQFYFATSQDIGSNSLTPPANYSGRSREVRCTTVDDYVQANRIAQVDLIKVDIEGGEYAMLSGAARLLDSRQRPPIIAEFEEARQLSFGNSCAKLAALLEGRDYRLFRLNEPLLEAYMPRANDAASFNILAIPSDRTDLLAELRTSPLQEDAPAAAGR